jgi:hypothetical protein
MESACAGACADARPAAPHTLGASAKPGADAEAHDLTCAICLETIALADLSVIKGCEHAYCGVAPSLRSRPDLLTECAVKQLPAASVAGVCADCDIQATFSLDRQRLLCEVVVEQSTKHFDGGFTSCSGSASWRRRLRLSKQ